MLLASILDAFLSNADQVGRNQETVVEYIQTLLSRGGREGEPVVRSTIAVMGGDACIRNTRIPVWTLVDYKRQGLSDPEILTAFPTLTPTDLLAAWEYHAANA